jgi:hypothetical protein
MEIKIIPYHSNDPSLRILKCMFSDKTAISIYSRWCRFRDKHLSSVIKRSEEDPEMYAYFRMETYEILFTDYYASFVNAFMVNSHLKNRKTPLEIDDADIPTEIHHWTDEDKSKYVTDKIAFAFDAYHNTDHSSLGPAERAMARPQLVEGMIFFAKYFDQFHSYPKDDFEVELEYDEDEEIRDAG